MDKVDWTSHIIKSLFYIYHPKHGYKYQIANSYVYKWESDFFCLTKSGYTYEIEVKKTRADFKKDFEKPKHRLFGSKTKATYYQKWEGRIYVQDGVKYKEDIPYTSFTPVMKEKHAPNKFYYATPSGLLTIKDIPRYAGWIEIDEMGQMIKKKNAPFIHKEKQFKLSELSIQVKLLNKFYWLSMKNKGFS